MIQCCFTTVVYGWYQDFIPIYIYSILRAFPQHFVKIFVLEPLNDNNIRALDLIKKNLSDHFEVVDNFTELNWCEIPHSAALRFLLTREYFEDFKYVYFGDVDLLIYNEYGDNFINSYLRHCEITGLPFSNEHNFYENKHRVTGLHFIIKDPYFDEMDDIIKEIRVPKKIGGWWNPTFRSQCFYNDLNPTFDEEMLYYMLSSTFDLRPLKNYGRPNHGWHLGEYRYYYMNAYKSPYYFSQRYMLLSDKAYQRMSEKPELDMIFAILEDPVFLLLYEELTGKAKDVVDIANRIIRRKLFV